MIERLAHIGIAVENAEAAAEVFCGALGGSVVGKKAVPDMNLEITLIRLGGVELELLSPTGDGPIAKFIKSRGPGLHHLAFEAADVEEALSTCRERGINPVDSAPRKGALAEQIAFLHPGSTAGVLIELCSR